MSGYSKLGDSNSNMVQPKMSVYAVDQGRLNTVEAARQAQMARQGKLMAQGNAQLNSQRAYAGQTDQDFLAQMAADRAAKQAPSALVEGDLLGLGSDNPADSVIRSFGIPTSTTKPGYDYGPRYISPPNTSDRGGKSHRRRAHRAKRSRKAMKAGKRSKRARRAGK